LIKNNPHAKRTFVFLAPLALLLALSLQAIAADTADLLSDPDLDPEVVLAPSETVASAESGAEGRIEPEISTIGEAGQPSKWGLSYFGVYSTPALASFTRSGTINTNTAQYDSSAPQNLFNQFKLDYFLSPTLFVGPIVNFQIITEHGGDLLGQDSGARIGTKQLFHTDTMNYSADLRLYAPWKPSTRKAGELMSAQTVQNFTWDVPKSKFTLGVLQVHQYYQYNGTALRDPLDSNTMDDVTLYFAPNVSYKLSKSFAATLWFEFYPHHILGAGIFDWSEYPTDIAPGVSWDLTENINISPQVLIYPGHPFIDTLSGIIYLSAKIL
jgi:hypothetical protein